MTQQRSIKAFVSGPYSQPDVGVNVSAAMKVADDLIKAGYAPYLPHLWHFQHIAHPHEYATWLGIDLDFLTCCDVVCRLPGISPGADVEESIAVGLHIPVVHLDTTLPIAPQVAKVLR